MTRVLITGGAGFIGSHLAARLSTSSCEVVGLDNLHPQVHLDPQASAARFTGELIRGDITDKAIWDSLPHVDFVVHLAAETGTGQSMYEADRYRSVNVGGTEYAGRFAARQKAVLVSMSSRAVYGEGRYECPTHEITFGSRCCELATPQPSQETDNHKPVSVYGETKSEAEAWLLDNVIDDNAVAIVRPQNVIGPGQALHNPYTGVLAAFLSRLREELPLQIYGDGHQTRDFIHVDDLCDLIEWIIANPPLPGEPLIVNAGSGQRTSLVDLANHAIAGAPIAGTIEHIDVHRAGDIDHACADLTRAGSLGAPLASHSAADSVRDFIRWGWNRPGASAVAWDKALRELSEKGLTT